MYSSNKTCKELGHVLKGKTKYNIWRKHKGRRKSDNNDKTKLESDRGEIWK